MEIKHRMPHKELTRIARIIGKDPSYLSRIFNCNIGVSKPMAILLSKGLKVAGYEIKRADLLFSQETIKQQLLEQYVKNGERRNGERN